MNREEYEVLKFVRRWREIAREEAEKVAQRHFLFHDQYCHQEAIGPVPPDMKPPCPRCAGLEAKYERLREAAGKLLKEVQYFHNCERYSDGAARYFVDFVMPKADQLRKVMEEG